MRSQLLMAAAVALTFSGAVTAGEMKGSSGMGSMDSSNPAEKGIRTPTQPNETQPGMSGSMKGDGMKKGERMKDSSKSRSSMKGGGEMKGDAMSGGSMGKGNMSSGNPAEKGVRTPSQPNETQPGMGPNKK